MPPIQTFTTVAGGSISTRRISLPDRTFKNMDVLGPDFESRCHFGKISSLEKSGFKRIQSSKVACKINMDGLLVDHAGDFFSYRYEFSFLHAESFLSLEWKRVLSVFLDKKRTITEMACTLLVDEFQKSENRQGGPQKEKESGIILAAKYSFSYCQEGAITLEENNFPVRRGFVDTGHYTRGNLTNNPYIGTMVMSLSTQVNPAAKKAAAEILDAGALNVALVLSW